MASSKWTATWVVVLLFALAPAAGLVLHEHDAQHAAHADCDACHFRHLSGVATDGTPVSSAPVLVPRAVVSAATDGGERGAALGIRPTRGPPA